MRIDFSLCFAARETNVGALARLEFLGSYGLTIVCVGVSASSFFYRTIDVTKKSRIQQLREAKTRQDLAILLGFELKSLTYIVYKKPRAEKYSTFQIPKRGGGVREINAPADDLCHLQRRLSDLLNDCLSDINEEKGIDNQYSHGFRRGKSIVSNAEIHKRRRNVFNIDLVDFFGSINFGRVRGYFIRNKNFLLSEEVATTIAQIACHNNSLPQGSPCSPVISNLIGHILDVRLAKLAVRHGRQYSRYADDISFSTNRTDLPSAIAIQVAPDSTQWTVGKMLSRIFGKSNFDMQAATPQNQFSVGDKLARILNKSGFAPNPKKTRLQFYRSRQDVTGLVVNTKVNTRIEYRKMVRSMTYRLLTTGAYTVKSVVRDDDGNAVEIEKEGTLDALQGKLAFIHHVGVMRSRNEKKKKGGFGLSADEKVFRSFLYYRNFFANERPVIIFEGSTDYIYVRCALNKLASKVPSLARLEPTGAVSLSVKLFKYSHVTKRLFGLGGGTGDIKVFLQHLKELNDQVGTTGMDHPVIILADNDSGLASIESGAKDVGCSKIDKSKPFTHLGLNFYVVPTPLGPKGEDTMIEDFFEKKILAEKIGNRTFHPSNKGFDNTKNYTKAWFAEKVVLKKQGSINFSGFEPMLKAIASVIVDYSAMIKKAS